MTQNQIAYQYNMGRLENERLANRELARHNRAVESETTRSNVAKESETARSNVAREAETNRSNVRNEALKRQEQWNKYGYTGLGNISDGLHEITSIFDDYRPSPFGSGDYNSNPILGAANQVATNPDLFISDEYQPKGNHKSGSFDSNSSKGSNTKTSNKS